MSGAEGVRSEAEFAEVVAEAIRHKRRANEFRAERDALRATVERVEGLAAEYDETAERATRRNQMSLARTCRLAAAEMRQAINTPPASPSAPYSASEGSSGPRARPEDSGPSTGNMDFGWVFPFAVLAGRTDCPDKRQGGMHWATGASEGSDWTCRGCGARLSDLLDGAREASAGDTCGPDCPAAIREAHLRQRLTELADRLARGSSAVCDLLDEAEGPGERGEG